MPYFIVSLKFDIVSIYFHYYLAVYERNYDNRVTGC